MRETVIYTLNKEYKQYNTTGRIVLSSERMN